MFFQSYQIGGRQGSIPDNLEVPLLEMKMFSMAKIAYHPFLVAVHLHVDRPPVTMIVYHLCAIRVR